MRYEKVIFCSKDCTYRAPVAAEVLKKTLLEKSQLTEMLVEAKGMTVMFPEPVNGKAVAIGKSRGYDLESYIAMQITGDDLSIDNLVLVMTVADKKKLYNEYTNAINVYTISEFVGETRDIEMPFGLSLADYGENFKQLENLIEKLADKLININK